MTPDDDGNTLPESLYAGIAHCLRGEWHRGLAVLKPLREGRHAQRDKPGYYYSFLGHALARCERRYREAAELCEEALRVEFYRAENWLNLAWVHLLAGKRSAAVRAVEQGLAMDAEHRGLRAMQIRLGARRHPVLGFLPRGHALNVQLGRMRHAMTRPRSFRPRRSARTAMA